MEDERIFGDVAHGVAVVQVADVTPFVDYNQSGHAAKFHPFHLLSVKIGDGVLGIGQADKGVAVILPETLESLFVFRPDHQDLGPGLLELRSILMQLHHVPAAIRSHEATVEDQHHMLLALIIREGDGDIVNIREGEIRSEGIFVEFCHDWDIRLSMSSERLWGRNQADWVRKDAIEGLDGDELELILPLAASSTFAP